jgi:hypothetical protein
MGDFFILLLERETSDTMEKRKEVFGWKKRKRKRKKVG